MSDKHFVGLDIISSSNNGRYKPVSRLTLMVDDNNAITAGDDTGFEIVADCPHATQGMVDNLLASLQGYEYQAFDAGAAGLDPAAELGDGVSVGGLYSVLAHIEDDGDGYPSISAPGEAELEDEYPAAGPMTQAFNRQIAATRASITKTADQIRLEIVGTQNAVSSLELDLDSITGRIQGVEGDFAEMALTLDGLTVTDANGETKINGSSVYTKNLYVDAANISGTLVAGELQGDYIYILDDDGNAVGSITVNAASTADYKLDIKAEAIAITTEESGGSLFLGNADGAFVQIIGTRVYCNANYRPSVDNSYDLGGSSYRWDNIYATNDVIQTSDRRRKKNISYGLDKYDALFDGLKASSYQLEGGTRFHNGLVAQDIEELLQECDIDTMEFAAFVKTEREDGTGYDYGLRYGEFIPLLIEQVQKLKTRLSKMEARYG